MAFPYVDHTWAAGHVLSIARMNNLESQFQSILDLLTTADDIPYATGAGAWARLAVAASTIIGKGAAGNLAALTGVQIMAILTGQAGADFSMNTNKITSVTDPGAAQDAATKNYVDTNDVDATREFFVPIFYGNPVPVRQGVLVDGVGEQAFLELLFPQDFTAITNIEVIFLPLETGASMHFEINTRWGAYNGGENHDVHAEAANNRDIGATITNQNLNHSISDLVDIAAPVAGDLLSVDVLYNATAVDSNAYVRGLRLKY